MQLPKNLIIALIGLALYTQANNINLANNTTMMLVILALLCEEKHIEDVETETEHIISQQSNHNHTTPTPVVYSNGYAPYPVYNACGYPAASPYGYHNGNQCGNCQPVTPYSNNYHHCGCGTTVY